MSDRRIDWLAVAVGGLADMVGTMAFMALFSVLVAAVADAQHVPVSEMEARLQRPAAVGALMVIGLAFTVLGGFVAGRMAKVHEVRHGALVGLASLILGLAYWGSLPLWMNIGSLVIVVPCGMLGGLIAENARGKA